MNGGLSLPKEREELEDKDRCVVVNVSNLYFDLLPQAGSIPLWPQWSDHAIVRQ